MYFDTKRKDECSGCTACMNACPVSAITMKEDKEGFLYPEVDDNVCINCGLCQKVCSWEHPQYMNNSTPIVLASILKDKKERKRSTSGGGFYAVSQWILQQGGVIYGAAFDEKLNLVHIGVENESDLQKLRGSKYLQSNLGNIYNDVRKQLENNRWCYFTGTGCQIAGLKAYLRKEYSKLVTSDLVCHGVPSQKIFNEHIAFMENKYRDKVVNYKFRDYSRGGVCETCGFANRRTIIKPSYELSPYLYSFMYGMTYRYSCYVCKFAKIPRQGDITLADYWGVEKYFPKFDRRNGCSLIILNTPKGEAIWDLIKDSCNYELSNVQDAARYNGNLIRSSEMPDIRKTIYLDIEERGYNVIANEAFRSPRYNKILMLSKIARIPVVRPVILILKKLKKCVF